MSDVIVLGTDQRLWLEHAPFGNVPPSRDYIDQSVAAFQFLDNQNVLVLGTGGMVLGTGGNLWLEHPPWAHGPRGLPAREQIDSNVVGFQGIDAQNVLVLGADQRLWWEHAPFGNVPPRRDYIDQSVAAFPWQIGTAQTAQFLDSQNVLVLGADGNLWLEHPPWGPTGRHSPREQIDSNVAGFQGIDAQNVLVLGTNRRLWLEHAPFGNVPPSRHYIDQSVGYFQFLDSQNVLVLGADGNLWLEHPPWAPPGRLPPREQIDSNVAGFQGLDTQNVLVLGTDGNLWWEHAPFGNVPPNREPIDSNVAGFQALATTQLLRHARAGGHPVDTRLQ